jgi:hypothetical protein
MTFWQDSTGMSTTLTDSSMAAAIINALAMRN